MTSLHSILKAKDYMTLLGTTFAFIAVILALERTLISLFIGFFLITLVTFTDALDGWIAKKTGTVNDLGKEIDSLSDCFAFSIAPAILTFQAFKTSTCFDTFLLAGCLCFALCGLLRLARFNITEDTGYTGVPVSITALFCICFYYIHYYTALTNEMVVTSEPQLSEISILIAPAVMICLGWFNITTHLRWKKHSQSLSMFTVAYAIFSPLVFLIGILNIHFIVNMIFLVLLYGLFSVGFIFMLLSFFRQSKTSDENEP